MKQITKYTIEGKPVWAINFQTGEVCELLRLTRWGTTEVCALQTDGFLERYNGDGYLKPCEKCIVWEQEEIGD